jgi:hypothetical protein
VFDRTTDLSWLELTSLDHPLLRKLSIEAPGNLPPQHLSRTPCRSRRCRHSLGKPSRLPCHGSVPRHWKS